MYCKNWTSPPGFDSFGIQVQSICLMFLTRDHIWFTSTHCHEAHSQVLKNGQKIYCNVDFNLLWLWNLAICLVLTDFSLQASSGTSTVRSWIWSLIYPSRWYVRGEKKPECSPHSNLLDTSFKVWVALNLWILQKDKIWSQATSHDVRCTYNLGEKYGHPCHSSQISWEPAQW